MLLTQGAEGIAVGLSCKILPHNFNEVIDAAVHYLRDEEFHLYPDFQTGGYIDVSHYNDGERGGYVRVRAKIEKLDNKTLLVKDVPYGKTTGTVIESILKAGERGKIKRAATSPSMPCMPSPTAKSPSGPTAVSSRTRNPSSSP